MSSVDPVPLIIFVVATEKPAKPRGSILLQTAYTAKYTQRRDRTVTTLTHLPLTRVSQRKLGFAVDGEIGEEYLKRQI